MRRWVHGAGRRAAVVLACGSLLLGGLWAAPATAASGATTSGTFVRLTDAAMPYWLYVPASYVPGSPMPLVVYLHGCNQSVPDAALGSRWNAVAEQKGFLVAYPEQPVGLYPAQPGNVSRCWNFSSPLEWARGGVEAGGIAAVTQRVMAVKSIDTTRVFVTGISAGGAMASNMAGLYPDLYAAAGVLLGCSFPCGDASGTGAYQAMGTLRRRMPVLVVAGAVDPAINPAVGEETVMQWLSTNDYVDDGLLNGSVSQNPATLTQHDFETLPAPGGGDPCVSPGGPTKLPCPGGAAGYSSYPYTVRTYNDAAGRDLLDYWIIYGLSHAYPGGDPAASFTDPAGPDVTNAAYQFFMAHPR
jgi:poly(hydroxyalkanoate) depolymerase family esterase